VHLLVAPKGGRQKGRRSFCIDIQNLLEREVRGVTEWILFERLIGRTFVKCSHIK